MGKRNKRRKPRGHFCYSCGYDRPNEAFNKGGRRRHVCSRCAQTYSPNELAVRQGIRDIDRLLRWDLPIIPRRKRRAFDRFLEHREEGVRRYAEEPLADDRRERRMLRAIEAQHEGALEAMQALIEREHAEAVAGGGTSPAAARAPEGSAHSEDACDQHDECIPF